MGAPQNDQRPLDGQAWLTDPPPLDGPGSDLDTWAGYATANGVDYPADADRNGIIAAVKAARDRPGLPPGPALAADPALDEKADEAHASSDDGTVWLHTSTGTFHVEIGSATWERLIAEGATRVDAPED